MQTSKEMEIHNQLSKFYDERHNKYSEAFSVNYMAQFIEIIHLLKVNLNKDVSI